MRNHSHLSLNDSKSHQSSSDQKDRVKRALFLPHGMLSKSILYLITTSRPTTETPWLETYNETHNIVQNYTFRHIVKATDEREDIISLDYSKDLHTWHTEKYSRCQSYKDMLDECDRNNLTSQNVRITSPLKVVETEEALLKAMSNNLTVKTCETIVGLMSLCHSENIFPERHIDMSKVWQPVNLTNFNESGLNDTTMIMHSFNQTEQRIISGLASVDIPFLVNGSIANVSEISTELPWETLGFKQDSWEHWNDNPTRSFVEAAWEHLNQSELSMPSFTIPMREKRSPQSQEIEKAKPKVKRQIGVIASSLLGMAKSGAMRGFLFNLVGPVLKNLVSGGHKHAVKQVAKHIIPYTGLKDHDTAQDVHQLLHEGNVSHAIQTLKNSTAKFRPQNLWLEEPMPHKDSIISYKGMNSYQVYRSARKILPYIDHMLTDRLKSQSIVDTSLTTALFGGLKKSLNLDLTTAGEKLQKVLVNTLSSIDEHQIDRITIYSICSLILIVSLAGIGLVIRCLYKVHTKVDKINHALSGSEEDIPLTSTSRPQSKIDWCKPSQTCIEMGSME